MTDLAIDVNTGDLLVSAFDLTLINNSADMEQLIRTRLNMLEGEWSFDTSAGIPWITDVLGKPVSAQETIAPIKSEILSIPGVLELLSFNVDYNPTTRRASINFSVNTDYGAISIQEVI